MLYENEKDQGNVNSKEQSHPIRNMQLICPIQRKIWIDYLFTRLIEAFWGAEQFLLNKMYLYISLILMSQRMQLS